MIRNISNYGYGEEVESSFAHSLANAHYNTYESPSPKFSEGSPFAEGEPISDKSKKMRKKRNTYMKIDDDSRKKLLDAVQQGETLKAAAKRYNINYSSAKSILHTFRKEGRIHKKSAQERIARKRTKNTTEMEMSPLYRTKQYQDDEDDDDSNQEPSTSNTLYHNEKFSSSYGITDSEGPKSSFRGMTINSFGGFLRVDTQAQPKPEAKSSTSTIVLSLDSQKKEMNPNSQSIKGRNWQLNVNVHNPVTEKINAESQRPLESLKVTDKLKSFESFYMNCATSPLLIPSQHKKEENNFEDKNFFKELDAFTDMLACMDETAPAEPHNLDVSCFLSTSPTYPFHKRASEGVFGGFDYFGGMDHLINFTDSQNLFFENSKKNSCPNNMPPSFDQGTGNVTKPSFL